MCSEEPAKSGLGLFCLTVVVWKGRGRGEGGLTPTYVCSIMQRY